MTLPPVFPVPLAKTVLIFTPPAVLSRVVEVVAQRMASRHPKLFANLAGLPPATVHLVPTDVPHRFGLRLGATDVPFYVLNEEETGAEARVTGSLQALVDMLEGREDGDALFFSREIQVTGDTTVIVGLRNTLDREEIALYDEIAALCGPFAPAAGLAMRVADGAARRFKAHLSALHDELHRREQERASS